MYMIVAFCGITCTNCKAFIATKENNDTKREEIAKEWKIKPEEVNCDGCINPNGRHINYWSTCEIRKCGAERKVENCAYCIDYTCEKLDKFHEHASKAKETLEEIYKQQVKKSE